jgi:hypothetical protein
VSDFWFFLIKCSETLGFVADNYLLSKHNVVKASESLDMKLHTLLTSELEVWVFYHKETAFAADRIGG